MAQRLELDDQSTPESNGYCVRPRACLELRQQVTDVRLHRLFAEEEALADLAVHEAVGDQLQDLDLSHRRLLLELLDRAGERDHLGACCARARVGPLPAPCRGDLVEPTGVIHVPGQDLFTLSCVHVCCIGGAERRLEAPTPI